MRYQVILVMKKDKELYRQLRTLPREKLWQEEVRRFNEAEPRARMERVAVIRAVGVVFAGASAAEKAQVKTWLLQLLEDPNEKIRRYAMAVLPKFGGGVREESALLALWEQGPVAREQKYLGRALDKLGGTATLHAVAKVPGALPQTEQKVKARVARIEQPSCIRLDQVCEAYTGLRIHLRCRKGLEQFVREELNENTELKKRFRILEVRSRYVAITPLASFSLADLYQLRCFSAVGFVLGSVATSDPGASVEPLAALIASPLARTLLSTFTAGGLRYRLEFISKGHQRGTIHQVVNRAFALCPDILNDARKAPWSMDVHPLAHGSSLELRPRLSPDPRMFYRQDDVPAASHPPLAACMARLAGRMDGDIVWDPFCGSGLELIERALRGGVRRLMGTDLSPAAIAISQANVAAAHLESVAANFTCGDFRNYQAVEGLAPASVTLIITNPPMGRRVRIKDMRGLFTDFFNVAARVLKPGGRLVFPNPLRLGSPDASLKLEYRQVVDLGGFDCRLEMYRKLPA